MTFECDSTHVVISAWQNLDGQMHLARRQKEAWKEAYKILHRGAWAGLDTNFFLLLFFALSTAAPETTVLFCLPGTNCTHACYIL
jgi:hypothetical protein